MISVYEMSRRAKSIGTGSKLVVVRGWRRADGEWLLMGTGFPGCSGTRDRWGVYNAVNIVNAPERFILKWLMLGRLGGAVG